MPPDHLHPSQAERFEVIEGSMRAIVGDEERVYDAGESFEVPAGTPHQMGAGEPTPMRWKVRPRTSHRRVLRAPLRRAARTAPARSGEAFFAEFENEFRLA